MPFFPSPGRILPRYVLPCTQLLMVVTALIAAAFRVKMVSEMSGLQMDKNRHLPPSAVQLQQSTIPPSHQQRLLCAVLPPGSAPPPARSLGNFCKTLTTLDSTNMAHVTPPPPPPPSPGGPVLLHPATGPARWPPPPTIQWPLPRPQLASLGGGPLLQFIHLYPLPQISDVQPRK